jgi:hypothetical protein
MNSFRLFSIILVLALFNCSGDKDKKTVSQEETLKERIKGLSFEIISENKMPGLSIKDLYLDTTYLQHDVKGLMLTFNVEVKHQAMDSIARKGYNAYFIDVTCTADGKTYSHRGELFKPQDKKKFIHKNRDCFIAHSTNRRMEVSFPYRLMELNEGEKELTVNIEAYSAKFDDDSSGLNMKHLEGICPRPDGSMSIKLKVKAPRLYKAAVTVHKARINTSVVNPNKYDFAMGGQGLPDLFWEVYLGNDYLYYSPVMKNKIEYNKKYSSPFFYCTAEDIIHIALVDYDNGPFNRQDDVIEKWSVRTNKINKNKIDTLRFGNLEYMVVEMKVE